MIEEKESENKNFLKSIDAEKGHVRTKITQLELEKKKADQANAIRVAKLAQIEENKQRTTEAKDRIKHLKEEKEAISAEIQSAMNFNAKKLDMQTELVTKHFDKVSLKLYDLVKSTGEIKPTFKLLYEGREFQVLSGAERVKAGLEISNLIINLLGLQFPIFIDNAESITHYNKPNTQIIEARVVEGQELKVEQSSLNKEDAA